MDREGNPKLLRIDATDDTTVAHAPTLITMLELKPDIGFLYEVISIFALIPDPVGSAAGTHTLEFSATGRTSNDDQFLKVTSNTGTAILIRDSNGLVGTSEVPSGQSSQDDIIHHTMWASNDWPILIEYKNSTDVDQSGTRQLFVLVKIWREAI